MKKLIEKRALLKSQLQAMLTIDGVTYEGTLTEKR